MTTICVQRSAPVTVKPTHPDSMVCVQFGDGVDATMLVMSRAQFVELIEDGAAVVGYRVSENDEPGRAPGLVLNGKE